jgi:hypothetical protein
MGVGKALRDYGQAIREGVAQLGMEGAGNAGEGSTVMAILNRVLIDEQAKIRARTSCCEGLPQRPRAKRCKEYSLPPLENG